MFKIKQLKSILLLRNFLKLLFVVISSWLKFGCMRLFFEIFNAAFTYSSTTTDNQFKNKTAVCLEKLVNAILK